MFLQACVILFTGGICLSACWDTIPPRSSPPQAGGTPPGADTPQEQAPPREGTPPGADTPREQTPRKSRHPPEQAPPRAEHAGRYRQCAGGTHPTGMQSCLTKISLCMKQCFSQGLMNIIFFQYNTVSEKDGQLSEDY